MAEREHGFATRAIHAGQEPDPVTGAVMPPIYQTSTYVQEAVGQHKGYEYARTHNRTRAALEACVASLEGVEHGIAFGCACARTRTPCAARPPPGHRSTSGRSAA